MTRRAALQYLSPTSETELDEEPPSQNARPPRASYVARSGRALSSRELPTRPAQPRYSRTAETLVHAHEHPVSREAEIVDYEAFGRYLFDDVLGSDKPTEGELEAQAYDDLAPGSLERADGLPAMMSPWLPPPVERSGGEERFRLTLNSILLAITALVMIAVIVLAISLVRGFRHDAIGTTTVAPTPVLVPTSAGIAPPPLAPTNEAAAK